MFNLITTLLICLGMSNTGMPISNYNTKKQETQITLDNPKKANETNNYTLNIEIRNDTQTGTSQSAGAVSLLGRRRTFGGYNNYLNVVGTYYSSEMRQSSNVKNHYIGNAKNLLVNDVYNGYQTNYLSYKIAYCFSITPYQFNKDNETTMTLFLSLNGIQATHEVLGVDYYYYYQNFKINQRYYESLDNSFDNYIGQQVTVGQVTTIENDIKDINNGYFYNYSEKTTTYTNTTIADTKTFEKEITITPGRTNYYVFILEIFGTLNSQWYEDNGQQEPNFDQLVTNSGNYSTLALPFNTGTSFSVTGTNIIPTGTYEVVDIPGFMFEILTMPFSFISTAFNLTIFPGTPYQLNIANLFLGVFAILIFIFILKTILKASI